MICPVCEKEIPFRSKVCESCGQDLTIYKRSISASNMYYNVGLEKAKVRDLTGAVNSLKRSLRFNKKNIEARNLLGIVYYEMGEVVEALSQWVLSKNFQSVDNAADYYINDIQKNASSLESINQTIKKYNTALNYAKQGSEDLAVMQLEKVINLNPKFIRSYQLLALLYMKAGDNKKAAKCLSKANKIDRNNTLTLKYMDSLPASFFNTAQKPKSEHPKILPTQDISPQAFSQGSYKEDKFNFWPYLNLLIGAVLGVLVVYFLIVPTAKKGIATQYENQFKNYSDEMASKSIQMTQLTNEKEALDKQLTQLQSELDKLKESNMNEKEYKSFYKAISYYMSGDKENAALNLSKVKESALLDSEAKKIYKTIQESTFIDAAEDAAEEGRITYNSGKFEEAVSLFKRALKMDSTNVKAIYFLGRSYHRLGEKEKARDQYNTLINDYPDSERTPDAIRRLAELGDS